MKTPIIGTGLSGLVGTRLLELLADQFEFINLSLETDVDITDPKNLAKHLNTKSPKVLIHMAARTDVDGIEAEKSQGCELQRGYTRIAAG